MCCKCVYLHCAKHNLNIRKKTESVTAGADATVQYMPLFGYIYSVEIFVLFSARE